MTQQKGKTIDILEDAERLTINLKDGFADYHSVSEAISEALKRSSNKRIHICLLPQSKNVHSAINNIRRQLISLRAPKSAIDSRSCNLFRQTYTEEGKREIYATTYKLETNEEGLAITFNSFKHPVAAYDDTAEEVARIVAQDTPQKVEATFSLASNEDALKLHNRVVKFGEFLKQKVIEVPQVEQICLWKKEKNGKASLVVDIRRDKLGRMYEAKQICPSDMSQDDVETTQISLEQLIRNRRLQKG